MSASDQDELTGTNFTLLLEASSRPLYKILDDRHWKTMIPGWWKTNEVSHPFSPDSSLERVSRLWRSETKPRQSAWAEKTVLQVWGDRVS